MKAVLHYTRQFAQIMTLPEDRPPPQTIEGLGGMAFERIDANTAGKRWTLTQHCHYCPVESNMRSLPGAPEFF